MMGLIYHLEDPIGAIRKASKVTKHVLLLKPRFVPEFQINRLGHLRRQEKIQVVFSIIDETDQLSIPLASITGIALCPSTEAVIWILEKTVLQRLRSYRSPGVATSSLRAAKESW
jgi:hypothetical protein